MGFELLKNQRGGSLGRQENWRNKEGNGVMPTEFLVVPSRQNYRKVTFETNY